MTLTWTPALQHIKYLIHPNYLFSQYTSIAEHPALPILQREYHKYTEGKPQNIPAEKLFSEYFSIFLLLTLFLPVNCSIQLSILLVLGLILESFKYIHSYSSYNFLATYTVVNVSETAFLIMIRLSDKDVWKYNTNNHKIITKCI